MRAPYHIDIPISNEILLSEIRVDDIPNLVANINHKVISEQTLSIPYPYTEANGRAFVDEILQFESENRVPREWAIRKNGELIGSIGLLYTHGIRSYKNELGYWLGQAHCGKGLMSNIVQRFSDYFLHPDRYVRLEAGTFEHNIGSQKVLLKAGFEREGFLRKSQLKNGTYLNTYLFAKVRAHT